MGKGTIISGGTDGLYMVQIKYNRTRYEAQLARFAALRVSLVSAEAEETDAQKKALITLQIMSIDKAVSFLTATMPLDTVVSAWCADLTIDLSGDVGTIEVPGELTNMQIQPGYNGNAAHNGTRDGQIMPTVSMNAPQAYYNLAMLPGWQKWKPLSRYATITAIAGDTASVVLDTGTSSQQALVINQAATIAGVPIEYMDCDGTAFTVGDEVLVLFTGQDWSVPRIVGFKDNPKPCGGELILVRGAIGRPWNDPIPLVWYVIIFDPDTNAYATGIPTNSGPDAVFPCLYSDISDWVAAADNVSNQLYTNPWTEAQGRPTLYYPTCTVDGDDNTVVSGATGADGTLILYNSCTYDEEVYDNPDYFGVSTLDTDETVDYAAFHALAFWHKVNGIKIGTHCGVDWQSSFHEEGTHGRSQNVESDFSKHGTITYYGPFGDVFLIFSALTTFIHDRSPQNIGDTVAYSRGPCDIKDYVWNLIGTKPVDLWGYYGEHVVYQIFTQQVRAHNTDTNTGEKTCEDALILQGSTAFYEDPNDIEDFDPRTSIENTDFTTALGALQEICRDNNDTIDYGTKLLSGVYVRP